MKLASLLNDDSLLQLLVQILSQNVYSAFLTALAFAKEEDFVSQAEKDHSILIKKSLSRL